MPVTRNFEELVKKQAAADPAFAEALRRGGINSMTPAREALLAFAKAWTYPIFGNEDVPVTNRLFEEARALAKYADATAADPPGGWRSSAINRATARTHGKRRCTR